MQNLWKPSFPIFNGWLNGDSGCQPDFEALPKPRCVYLGALGGDQLGQWWLMGGWHYICLGHRENLWQVIWPQFRAEKPQGVWSSWELKTRKMACWDNIAKTCKVTLRTQSPSTLLCGATHHYPTSGLSRWQFPLWLPIGGALLQDTHAHARTHAYTHSRSCWSPCG